MALALHPNGSGIPGLDDAPRKPGKALLVGLGVSAALHVALIGYLAYQKWTQPLPTMAADTGFIVETVPVAPKAPPPPPPEERPPTVTAPKLHIPVPTAIETPPPLLTDPRIIPEGPPTAGPVTSLTPAVSTPPPPPSTAAKNDHPRQLAAHPFGRRDGALLSGKRAAPGPVRSGDPQLRRCAQRNGSRLRRAQRNARRRGLRNSRPENLALFQDEAPDRERRTGRRRDGPHPHPLQRGRLKAQPSRRPPPTLQRRPDRSLPCGPAISH